MITRFEKRVIAGMLAIMMCFSMVQFPVMAAEEQEVKTEESTVVENIVQEEAEETENVVEKEVESVNEKESTETQQEMITEVVSEEAGDIEEKEVSEIVLNDKYNADIEVMGKYKFTPKESGKYVFLASNYLYVNIRDDKEQYIGRFYNNNRIALVAGQTYYIEIETIKNQEWSLTKATEVELQLNTKYELTADQAVNYRFIPAQSNTYLFNLDNPGTITVYDSEWKSVAYGAKASLMAGEIYYIVVIPKEEILTWEVDKCEVSGEYSYKIQDNGTIGIMGYLGKQGIISIPESIDGKEVTVICAGAFNRNNIISEVSIPSNVKEIAGSAFSNCPNLRQVKFACKSKLENIGNGAFYFSEQLSNFIIPNGVKKLGIRHLILLH